MAVSVRVRAPHAGEGVAVSKLWRELWEVHEGFGGYETSHEPGAFEAVAKRIDEEARLRQGEPMLGRHAHLVAELDGRVVGQVEGWIDRKRAAARAPAICEVRSLIVAGSAQRKRVGRALMDGLFEVAARATRGEPTLAAAEVLDRNPARVFYDGMAFKSAAHALRIASRDASVVREVFSVTAREARPEDAFAVCVLDAHFYETRRQQGDGRLGPPREIDATLLSTVAESIRATTRGSMSGPVHFVITDATGKVRGKALFGVNVLLSPFARAKRAIVGFVAFDPSMDARSVATALVSSAGKLALLRGARWIEIVDLPRPETPMHDAFLAAGCSPWSATVIKPVK